MIGAKLRKQYQPILLGLIVVFACASWRISTQAPWQLWLEAMDNLVYDAHMKLWPSSKLSKNNPIIIVDIDDQSLARYGNWPWPRLLIAQLVKKLQEMGVIVVAFDVVFPKSEDNPAQELLSILDELPASEYSTAFEEHLKSLSTELLKTDPLIDQLKEGDNVLGFIFHNRSHSEEGALPKAAYHLPKYLRKDLRGLKMQGFTGNTGPLQQAGKHAGFLTTIPDHDGVIRRSPIVLRYKNALYFSLATEAIRLYLLQDNLQFDFQEIGGRKILEGIQFGNYYLSTDQFGRVIIPYRGGPYTFPYYSAAKIMEGDYQKSDFEHKIAFIGASALGMGDSRATPTGSVFPGVEVHANIADALLNQRFPMRPIWAKTIEFMIILSFGTFFAFLLPFMGGTINVIMGMLAPIFCLYLQGALFHYYNLVLYTFLPAIMFFFLALANLGYGMIFESRSKKSLQWIFGQYVPPEHVEEMAKNPGRYVTTEDTREMSVLFADIRNFTSISEQLSVVELKNLLNDFLTPMTQVIFEHHGTIDKYIGDMIMAFWGAPLLDEKHVRHAIQAALAMIDKCKTLQTEFAEKGLPKIEIGIGVNTGIMNVGDMGSEFRRSYTVLGDAVNLGSRLEGLTKFYGVDLVVGEACLNASMEDYAFRLLDKVQVKGKQQAICVYEVLGKKVTLPESSLEELLSYRVAMEYYYKEKWKKAKKAFKKLVSQNPESKIYQIYYERSQEYCENPPKHWEGVHIRHEK